VDDPQSSYQQESATDSINSMGDTFAYLLMGHTQGKLSKVRWFRTDWQRGGALTGFGQWDDGEQIQEVVVKLPVPPVERNWLIHAQNFENVSPKLFAHGDSLGGYDLAWVIMERMPHGPLNHHWQGREFDLLVEALGRFYAAGEHLPLTGRPDGRNWHDILQRSRDQLHKQSIPQSQRWSAALKQAHRKLDHWLEIWNQRPITGWCHGDLHLGNAMTRIPAPDGPAVLLDFAQARPGHWVEDAIYCEHLFWARRSRLGDRKLCSMLAKVRKHHHLPVDADWPRLATIKRKLLAMSTPLKLLHDGDISNLNACLEVLESEQA